MTNIILNSDSYKYSQFNQYPPGTEYIYSYIESRGGQWDKTLYFGLQAFIKEYLIKPITQENVDEAEEIILAHGEPFNREGWQYILDEYAGKLPISIKSAPEGLLIPTKNVLATIVNTDPKCYWLTSFLETAILRAIWYPTTVATNSYESKKIISAYLEKSGDPASINFKLHDFGFRGVSSLESGGLGGMAHLVNFMGTDTVAALIFARKYYGIKMAGFSIPAMEHSTVTSWGRENEVNSYRNMINKNAKPGGLIACVSDSWDIYKACEMWGTELKDDVISSGATVVIRPDSGDPVDVLPKIFRILGEKFGFVKNAKGYKILNNVRIIWGDGIDSISLSGILRTVVDVGGWSADNIAFGQGGALLQIVNRDTLKFAMKCSAIGVREQFELSFQKDERLVYRDVFKDPITDSGKTSKKGKITLWKSGNEYETSVEQPTRWTDKGLEWKEVLQEVFHNGELLNEITFDQVRANSNA